VDTAAWVACLAILAREARRAAALTHAGHVRFSTAVLALIVTARVVVLANDARVARWTRAAGTGRLSQHTAVQALYVTALVEYLTVRSGIALGTLA
jgi:hypothetical protein